MRLITSYSILLLFSFLGIGCKSKTDSNSATPEQKVSPDSVTSAFENPISHDVVLVSKDLAQTWQAHATGLPGNIHPSGFGMLGTEMILSTSNNGLFMTENNGSQWKDISNGLATKKINTMLVSGDEVYLGLSHEGLTMWKLNSSYWNSYNSGLPNRNVTAIVKVKDELLVGTDTGIFKSADKRQSWYGKHLGEPVTCLLAKGDTIFAGNAKGLMLSKDGGEKWTYVKSLGRIHALTQIDQFVYAQFASGDLYRTDNWGGNWEKINIGVNDHTPVYAIIKANDQYLLGHHQGIFASPNGKSGWKLIYPTEKFWFEDLLVKDQMMYGATDF